MNTPSVVVGVAGDSVDAYRSALVWGAAEAQRRGRALHLVHGVQPASMLVEPPADSTEGRLHRGRRVLDTASRLAETLAGPEVRIRTTNSAQTAVDALLAAADTSSVIVVQRRHRTLWEHVTSASVTEAVAARSTCPVVVVQTETTSTAPGVDRRDLPVVVGIDPEGRAGQALLSAAEEATWRGVGLTAVLAWEVPMADTAYVRPDTEELELHRSRAERELAETTAGLHDRYPDLDLDLIAVRGVAAEALVAMSQDAQLLVLARHTTSSLTWRALGATTRNVLRHSHSPVYVTHDETTAHLREHDRSAALWPSFSPR